jgi:hypothetical protein
MERRVTLRVESLDGRILPSAASGGFDVGDLSSPGLGSKPGGVGDGIQVLISKPGGRGEGIQGFSSKPGATGEGIQSFGSKGVARPGTNEWDVIELFGGKLDIAVG